jgi:hypothetical protein
MKTTVLTLAILLATSATYAASLVCYNGTFEIYEAKFSFSVMGTTTSHPAKLTVKVENPDGDVIGQNGSVHKVSTFFDNEEIDLVPEALSDNPNVPGFAEGDFGYKRAGQDTNRYHNVEFLVVTSTGGVKSALNYLGLEAKVTSITACQPF